ncbi:hypothetical protein BCR44DRAFT_1435281 [Catenaria anguillulae PL171]|uniref:Exocyst complex component 8 n=1 Tax=Catenaria anguillulae PL171 TaxID=765915 RepID=A0A1Y2HJT2_9FUNG|nr:hypothetical protein BCR44DRAFT_1435281 [Catenaria anguillulae PL171]
MADRSSPTLPRRERSRSRGAAVAEARERERARAGSSSSVPNPPNSQGFAQYLPSMPGARATPNPVAADTPTAPGAPGDPVVPRKADARKAHKREKSWSPLFKSSSDKQSPTPTDRQPSDPAGLSGESRRAAMLPGGVADSVKNSLRKFSIGDGSPLRSRGGSVGTGGGGVAIELDQHRFMDDSFDPEEYILTALHSNSEEGVRNFYRRLGDAKEAAATDLKANVYKNYSEFVVISKEIAQLETDMLVLRGLLTDMRAVHDHFRSYVGVDVSKSTGSADALAQSSNISLTQSLDGSTNTGGASAESQAAQVLQSMYDTVDGAAKLVPPSTARTIIHSGPLLELDSAMRVKGDVMVFLMPDTLLVAAKKRRMPLGSSTGAKLLSSSTSSGSGRYTALQALSVQEITVLDVRDSPDVSWSFKIVRGPISFVFRCPNGPAEKKTWMTAIKRATEDWSSGGGGGGLVGGVADGGGAEGPGTSPDSPSRAQPKLSKEAEAKLQELLDELDVYIASREFDRALDLVRQLKGMPSSSHLPSRIQTLSVALLRDLNNITSSNGSKRAVLTAMQRLIQLGHTAQARETFLSARTASLRESCRKIRFQGDLAAYVRDFGSVLVVGVHTTVAWYREAITDPAMVSFLVQWAREQVGELARATVRQVGDESLKVVVACLEVSVERIRTLRSSGLDLEFVFWDAVQEHAAKAIEAFERLCAEAVARSIIDDTFDPIKNDYNDGITRSTMQFCKTILDFLTNTKFFHPFQMFHAQLFGCLSGLFEAFVNWQIQVYREKPLNATQQSAVGTNVQFTLSLFFPKVIHQVERQFRAKAPMLAELRMRLEGVARDASFLGGAPAKIARSPSTKSLGTPPKDQPSGRRPSQPASPAATGSVASLAIPGSPARTSHGSLGPGSPDGSHGTGSRRSSSASANILAEPTQRPRRPTRDRSNELGATRSSGDVSNSAPGLARRPSAASSPRSSPSNSRHGSAADLAGSSPSPLFATLFDLKSRLSPTGPAAVAVASGADIANLLPSVAMRRFVRTRPSAHIVEQVLNSATEAPSGKLPVAAVTQLVLDIHYMLNSVEVSEQGAGTAQGLCEQGLRGYLMNGGDPGQLMSGEWYEQRVAEALARDARGEM